MAVPFHITRNQKRSCRIKVLPDDIRLFFWGTYFQKICLTFSLILNGVGLLQELLGTTWRKKQTTFDLPDQSVFIDLLEARN